MRFYSKSRRRPLVNIVPLIDILTLLLIFFLLSTTFKRQQPAVQIDLSEAEHGAPADAATPMIVHVSRENAVFLDDKPVALPELETALKRLRAARPEGKFALNADKASDFGVIVKVLDAFKGAGIEDVPAFTQEQEKPPQP